jgi:hypothetical protein
MHSHGAWPGRPQFDSQRRDFRTTLLEDRDFGGLKLDNCRKKQTLRRHGTSGERLAESMERNAFGRCVLIKDVQSVASAAHEEGRSRLPEQFERSIEMRSFEQSCA